jgi:hypothetical protein
MFLALTDRFGQAEKFRAEREPGTTSSGQVDGKRELIADLVQLNGYAGV